MGLILSDEGDVAEGTNVWTKILKESDNYQVENHALPSFFCNYVTSKLYKIYFLL